MSRPRRMLLAMLAGGAAVVFMSSSLIAAILVGVTLAIVVWDLLSEQVPPVESIASDPTPKKLSVDLRRRP
ncbi:MAG: hypothetical protein KIT31_24210 [Deltaproteobacteria bacterium]|nr:hypothetical protein [Deltaproteobacteria bacterium]